MVGKIVIIWLIS